jgi:hypothetical protein
MKEKSTDLKYMKRTGIQLVTGSFQKLILISSSLYFNRQDISCKMPGVHEEWIQELISSNSLIPNVGAFTLWSY